MGLDDREYMRDVPIYRRLIGRSEPPPPRPPVTAGGATFWGPPQPSRSTHVGPMVRPARVTRTRPWAWVLLAAIAVLAILTFAATRRSGSLPNVTIPATSGLTAPLSPQTYSLSEPTHVMAGSIETATGTLPPNVSGIVVVQAQWGNGAWYTLATTQAQGGSYTVRYQLAQPGIVHIRIELPNGDTAVATMTVT